MTKAIIVETKNFRKTAQVIFCENNQYYFKSGQQEYIEFRDVLKTISGATKFLYGMKERTILIEKLLTMDYKEAAKFYFNNQQNKNVKCNMFEGEFNGQ